MPSLTSPRQVSKLVAADTHDQPEQCKRPGVQGISGGIPHCFPQFGPGPIQQHGFARQVDWEIASTSADPQPDERDPEVELVLTDNDYTRKIWCALHMAMLQCMAERPAASPQG